MRSKSIALLAALGLAVSLAAPASAATVSKAAPTTSRTASLSEEPTALSAPNLAQIAEEIGGKWLNARHGGAKQRV